MLLLCCKCWFIESLLKENENCECDEWGVEGGGDDVNDIRASNLFLHQSKQKQIKNLILQLILKQIN